MKQRNFTGATLFSPKIHHKSFKNLATLKLESRWEWDYSIDCEFDNDITKFTSQPISFEYEYEGKKRRYTGDLMLQKVDGTFVYVEVKDSKYAECPKLKNKIEHISSLLQEHQDSSLILVTSKDIHDDPSHVTREILYRFMFLDVPKNLSKLAIKALRKADLTIEYLERQFVQKGASQADAWAFLAHNYSSIVFYGNPNISSTTVISWSK